MKQQRAFTLLEIMIVLVIIAIVTSIAVVSFSGFGRSAKLKNTAQELKSLMIAAQAEAIFMPATLGLQFNKQGYRFYRYVENLKTGEGAWKPLERDRLSNAIAVPPNIHVQFLRQKNIKTEKKSSEPQIIFLPTSDVSPFHLRISIDGDNHYYILTGKESGAIRLKLHTIGERKHT